MREAWRPPMGRGIPLVARRALLVLLIVALAGIGAPQLGFGGGSAEIVRHAERTDKVVALTFDDGWKPAAATSGRHRPHALVVRTIGRDRRALSGGSARLPSTGPWPRWTMVSSSRSASGAQRHRPVGCLRDPGSGEGRRLALIRTAAVGGAIRQE